MTVEITKAQCVTATPGSPSARVIKAQALAATRGIPLPRVLQMSAVGAYPSSAANPVNAKIPALQAITAYRVPWRAQNIYFVRNLVIGSKQQSGWGATMQDADLDRRVIFDASSVSSLGLSFDSNRIKAGRGTAFPSVRWATGQTFAFPNLLLDLDDYLAGWIAAFAMGSETVSGAGPYTHIAGFSSDGELAPTTLYIEDTQALHHKFPDVCVSQAVISANGRSVVKASLSLVGTGRYSRILPTFVLPPVPSRKMFMVRDSAVSIGPPGAMAAVDPDRIVSWQITINNNVARLAGPGGLNASKLLGLPSVQLSITLLAKETDDLVTLLKTRAACEIQISVVSAADCQCAFHFPLAYVSAALPATFDGLVGVTLSADIHSVMQPAADVPLEITTINSQPSYLEVAA